MVCHEQLSVLVPTWTIRSTIAFLCLVFQLNNIFLPSGRLCIIFTQAEWDVFILSYNIMAMFCAIKLICLGAPY